MGKEICKNCQSGRPSYKGMWCVKKGRKVKTQGTCEAWEKKTRR